MSSLPELGKEVPADETKTIKWAVIATLAFVFIIICIGLSIGGSYLVSLQAIHNAQVTDAALRLREAEASIRTAVPTCKALLGLDDARVGATFPHYPGVPQNQGYGVRLASAIHRVYLATRCQIVLQHKPIQVIMKELARYGN